MNGTTIIAILAGLGIVYKLLFGSKKTNEKIQKLEVEANITKEAIKKQDVERETLKGAATSGQANATEEQKSNFWTKELGVKKDE